MSLAAVFVLPQSAFPPLAVGFFGLGTGYMIYGTQELFSYPKRDAGVDFGVGIWGIWMPGFMQFITGVYLFLGLTLFETFTASSPLYMAALAFTAYGVHWFALGTNRIRRVDARVNVGMSFAFILISVLGMIVFFHIDDWPVALVFVGLTAVYVAEFIVSIAPDFPRLGFGGQLLGFFHLITGLWLFYLVFAVTLDFAIKWTLRT
jgi:hypothetical protein